MSSQTNSQDTRRKQLLYRANHRGIKEMDILLGGFAAENIAELDMADLDRFEALLGENDHDLLNWFTGQTAVPPHIRSNLFDTILLRQQSRLQEQQDTP